MICVARLTVSSDLARFEASLANVADKAVNIGKAMVYEGMRVLTDAYKQNIHALRVDNRFTNPSYKLNVVDAATKDAMAAGVGITKIEQRGHMVSASAGVSGYGPIHTQKYPTGQPLPMIARSVEGGSPWRVSQSFALKTVQSVEPAVNEAMQKCLEEMLEKMTR